MDWKQLRVGKKANGDSIWYTDHEDNWWSGDMSYLTKEELYARAKSIVSDLEQLYPELRDKSA